ncbi:hypothetical protein HB943_02050 [Listeria weihenstephanensis]|uniref:Uncharacterized protein n=1 Tax=Listeria weihenstephanensis TaxID=1006155 RepID=A0A841Z376_9LIST|nr:hypothetical protein [Listeria weihenstephanensis]MBC1499369.1 hypothetical protein [Listeria weihenstephanensis]
MISAVMDETAIEINKIVRPMLKNKKVQLGDLQGMLKKITEEIKDKSGLNSKWVRGEQSFYNGEITLRAKGYDICKYCIKYDLEQNLFIATEVL